jgi:ADP-ribose pyrophosphatase
MTKPSWEPHGESSDILEENWLFRLARERYRSTVSGKAHDYYVMHLADSVNIIALTPTRKVVLVRQFRAGSGHDSLETPGGLVDEGEDPLAAAVRELREETGFEGDPPRLLGVVWSNPSILTSRSFTVLITNVRHAAVPTPDMAEEVHVELAPAGQIPWMIRDGRIDHALAVQGLLHWLASELPDSPLAPADRGLRKSQFHIRSLMIAVAVSAGIFALLSNLGYLAGVALLWALALPFGPLLALRFLDPPNPAILLRGYRLRPAHQLFRYLAAVGMTVLIVLIGIVLVRLS